MLQLFRSKRGGDSEAKRKNSNSDKEDADLECGAGASTATPTALATAKNPEMQHRQRKQLSSLHNNNNNCNNINNGCELNKDKDDSEVAVLADSGNNSDSDDFLTNDETVKMSTFHSSPALSASALSNQTNQTNCDDDTSINPKLRYNLNHNNNNVNNTSDVSNGGTPSKKLNNDFSGRVLVHSASATANFNKQRNKNKQTNDNNLTTGTGSINSIDSITSLGLNSANGVAAGQSNGELKQVGGNKKRVSLYFQLLRRSFIHSLYFNNFFLYQHRTYTSIHISHRHIIKYNLFF